MAYYLTKEFNHNAVAPLCNHKQHMRNHPRPGSTGPMDYKKNVRGDYTLTHKPSPSKLLSSCVPDCPLHQTNNSNDEWKLHHSEHLQFSTMIWAHLHTWHNGAVHSHALREGLCGCNWVPPGFLFSVLQSEITCVRHIQSNKQMLRSRSTPCYRQNKGMSVSSQEPSTWNQCEGVDLSFSVSSAAVCVYIKIKECSQDFH